MKPQKKCWFVALFFFALIWAVIVSNPSVRWSTASTTLKGDVNGDERLDLVDVIVSMQIISGSDSEGILPGYVSSGVDVNDDGRVGIEEVDYILQRICAGRNSEPTANAGNDQSAFVGDTVQLDGSDSNDPEGDPLGFQWSLVALPEFSSTELSDHAALTPTLFVDRPGTYVVQLKVSDGADESAPDTVTITSEVIDDADGDTWADFQDCAPVDPLINPAVAEMCGDEVDNDCSGAVDDKDADNDGFIDLACGGDDVNDDDDRINPAVAEICNDGVDNNSNLLVDLNDPACEPGCDEDGDGHPSATCGGPDADDRLASVYPGAPEICDDFVDNDLDGQVDEGCHTDEVRLGPPDVIMLASDSRLFNVLDDLDRGIEWQFSVDSIVGGDESVGRIESLAPNLARYASPVSLAETIEVELRATDPADAGNYATTTVTVHPLEGDYTIKPGTATVGLSRKKRFVAGMNIEMDGIGIYFVPIKDVVWRINNNVEEDPQGGRIDSDGLYYAPNGLPDPLPYDIEVGFSLGENTDVLAKASVLVAKLDIAPEEFFGLQPGPVGVLSGQLLLSDNTQQAVPAQDIYFYPSRPRIATVDANGNVSIGELTGQCMLQAVHDETGARDFSIAHSISDVSLKVIPMQLFADFKDTPDGQGGVEVEFTRAGGVFQILPVVTVLRGQRKGEETAGEVQNRISFTPESENVEVIEDFEVPDLSGITAALEVETGIVFIGEEPGVGTINVKYKAIYGDSFVVQHTVPVAVRFSRIEMDVTVSGSISGPSEEFFVTELIQVDISLSNPSGSGFIGRTPIGVSLEGNEPFMVNYGIDFFSGVGATYYPMNQFVEVDHFQLSAGSTENEAQSDPAGQLSFKLSPKRNGLHRFLITLAHDPEAQPHILEFGVKRPQLGLCPCNQEEPLDLEAEGAFFPVNNWASIRAVDEGSVYNLYTVGALFSYSNNDLPVWHFTDGDGITTEIPLASALGITNGVPVASTINERLPENFGKIGLYAVYQGMTERPEMRTEALLIPVVGPESPGAYFPVIYDLPLDQPPDPDNDTIPTRGNTLGAFHVQEPTGGVWEPGQPIQIKIQTYDALGTAKVVGKTILEQYKNLDGDVVLENREHRLIGVSVWKESGPGFGMVSGYYYPDENGLISLTVEPSEVDPPFGEDLILKIFAAKLYAPEEEFPLGILPVEHIVYQEGGQKTIVTPAPIGIAVYENPAHKVLTEQCVLIEGRLVGALPRELPVASQKVRDAVAEGKIPPGYDLLRFRVLGTRAFEDAISDGVTGADLGDGMTMVDSVVIDGVLHVTASTDIDYFEVEDWELREERYGQRTVKFTTSDGNEWQTEVSMFGFALEKAAGHSIKDVPLNGDHHDGHEVASQVFFTNTRAFGSTPYRIDLEIVPSLIPESLLEQAEDEENELVTYRHQMGWIKTEFRGAPVEQPLLGFRREEVYDSETHERDWAVSDLSISDFERQNNAVTFFGDRTDKRRLDRDSKMLGPKGDPDLLPDFVSVAVDSELMAATLGGNMIDLIFFTAFNIMAEPQENLHGEEENPLDFDLIGGDANTLYRDLSLRKTTREISEAEKDSAVVVHVDRESDAFKVQGFSKGPYVPKEYWGGVLDQYFIIGTDLTPAASNPHSIGMDGRVGGYDDEGGRCSCRHSPTGRTRKCFGIELDGVLYDPNVGPWDKAPNSQGLLEVPIVAAHLGNPPNLEDALTENNLVPDIGGTSGGYYVIDKEHPGAGFALAKTPGQEFPGLHTGYLIQDKPEDLRETYFEIEDDIEHVLIERTPRLIDGGTDGMPVSNDDPLRRNKRVMGFADDFDHKKPVTTSLNTRRMYKVVTDPPNVGTFEIEDAALMVVERPRDPRDRIDLMVTTQSDGSEGYWKAVLDATTDLLVDLTADVVLGAITDGAWLAECGGLTTLGTIYDVGFAVQNALVGVEDQYLAENGFRSRGEWLVFANEVLQDGKKVGGAPVSVNLRSIAGALWAVDDLAEEKAAFKAAWEGRLNFQYSTLRNIGICPLLKSPFTALKGKIKNSLTVSELGGNGSAHAFATKVVTVSIPPDARTNEGDGLFTNTFTVTNMIEMLPKTEEQDFDLFHSSAEYGDLFLTESLINTMHSSDEQAAEQAEKVLDQMIVTSVKRERFSAGNASYEDYKLKIGMLPQLSGMVVPGKTVGDFVLTVDETRIAVSTASIVGVIRSNYNATGRAAIKTEGYDLIVIGATIP